MINRGERGILGVVVGLKKWVEIGGYHVHEIVNFGQA
jgi:hypothetical protein